MEKHTTQVLRARLLPRRHATSQPYQELLLLLVRSGWKSNQIKSIGACLSRRCLFVVVLPQLNTKCWLLLVLFALAPASFPLLPLSPSSSSITLTPPQGVCPPRRSLGQVCRLCTSLARSLSLSPSLARARSLSPSRRAYILLSSLYLSTFGTVGIIAPFFY